MKPWYITTDEAMGRLVPHKKIKEFEEIARKHCKLEKLEPGCLLTFLIWFKKTKFTDVVTKMRWSCKNCKYWVEEV